MPPLPRRVVLALWPALAFGCYQGVELSEGSGPTAGATTGSAAATSGEGSDATSTHASTHASTEAAPTTSASDPGTTSTGPEEVSSGPGSGETGAQGSSTGVDSDTDTGAPVDPVAAVCARWTADRSDMSEGTWSGDVAACDPGDTGAPGRDNALRLVNLYRWLAGLPPVGHDASLNARAQECALMMHANGKLSHSPGMDWECFSAGGKQAAANSNIASTPGVLAVDLYMVDMGNETTMGHRRWILSNALGPIGLGSTSVNSCMWVLGGQAGGTAAWTAWPPPGPVPIAAIHVPQVPWANVDETGWTIQSDAIDLSTAEVTIDEGGADRPVEVKLLQGGFGSASALSLTPQGWVSEPGKTYTVHVNGVPQPFSYDVQVVSCP